MNSFMDLWYLMFPKTVPIVLTKIVDMNYDAPWSDCESSRLKYFQLSSLKERRHIIDI